jgi:hypothetical protein
MVLRYKEVFKCNGDGSITLQFAPSHQIYDEEYLNDLLNFLDNLGCISANELKYIPEWDDSYWFVYEDLIYIIPQVDYIQLKEGQAKTIKPLKHNVYNFVEEENNTPETNEWLNWYEGENGY